MKSNIGCPTKKSKDKVLFLPAAQRLSLIVVQIISCFFRGLLLFSHCIFIQFALKHQEAYGKHWEGYGKHCEAYGKLMVSVGKPMGSMREALGSVFSSCLTSVSELQELFGFFQAILKFFNDILDLLRSFVNIRKQLNFQAFRHFLKSKKAYLRGWSLQKRSFACYLVIIRCKNSRNGEKITLLRKLSMKKSIPVKIVDSTSDFLPALSQGLCFALLITLSLSEICTR